MICLVTRASLSNELKTQIKKQHPFAQSQNTPTQPPSFSSTSPSPLDDPSQPSPPSNPHPLPPPPPIKKQNHVRSNPQHPLPPPSPRPRLPDRPLFLLLAHLLVAPVADPPPRRRSRPRRADQRHVPAGRAPGNHVGSAAQWRERRGDDGENSGRQGVGGGEFFFIFWGVCDWRGVGKSVCEREREHGTPAAGGGWGMCFTLISIHLGGFAKLITTHLLSSPLHPSNLHSHPPPPHPTPRPTRRKNPPIPI